MKERYNHSMKAPPPTARLIPLAAALLLLLLTGAAPAAEVTVTWTFATNNLDGTPITDLAGAKVYYGTQSSNYTHVIDVPGGEPGQTCDFTVTGLVENTEYYLNGTAYNTAGLESDFCTETMKIAVNGSGNQAPQVTISHEALDAGVVALNASIQDDGPIDNISLTWSVEEGPDTATFSATDTPSTVFTFVESAAYVCQLVANDGDKITTVQHRIPRPLPPPQLQLVEIAE